MGVTTSGLRWPAPTDPVAQGAAAIRNLAEDVTTRGAQLLGSGVVGGATLPAGGGTLGIIGAVNVAAVPYPRIIVATLIATLASATTWVSYAIRVGGAAQLGPRAITPQQTTYYTFTELVPANTARTYDATVTSGAAASVYSTPGLTGLSVVGYLAA